MANAAASIKDNEDSSEFAALLSQSLGTKSKFTGQVVNGRVVRIDDDTVIVDVGLKSEGRIALREFTKPGQEAELRAGDTVEVFVERMEDREGQQVAACVGGQRLQPVVQRRRSVRGRRW